MGALPREAGPPAGFATTPWGLVALARGADAGLRRESLEQLCRVYWAPIHAFLRRARRLEPAAAEETTQDFFAYLLEHELIERADAARGSFRNYVKGILRNFLKSSYRRARGAARIVAVDPAALEQAAHADGSPEEILDRAWASATLREAERRARRRLEEKGAGRDWAIFGAFREQLGGGERPSFSQIARSFGLSRQEVATTIARIRRRLRVELIRTVSETVSDPRELKEELANLPDRGRV
jgi:RNA polymerase sigma-70 factor (ECF subfamily)